MRKLGEQWIEELDRDMHMYKCIGLNDDMSEIIKDLGILNEQGCLPAPWDKNLYPNIDNCIIDGKDTGWDIYVDCFNIEMVVNAKTLKQAIDLWNRRA